MLNDIRMGKLAEWRPRGHHEHVRESYIMNFVYYKRKDRDLPCRLSAGRKKVAAVLCEKLVPCTAVLCFSYRLGVQNYACHEQ